MTTTFVNVDFQREITSFMNPDTKVSTFDILHAIYDSLKSNGPNWMQSPDAKALLHTLNQTAHGKTYLLNAQKEQRFLEKLFRQAA